MAAVSTSRLLIALLFVAAAGVPVLLPLLLLHYFERLIYLFPNAVGAQKITMSPNPASFELTAGMVQSIQFRLSAPIICNNPVINRPMCFSHSNDLRCFVEPRRSMSLRVFSPQRLDSFAYRNSFAAR
jgi:hypothetical protein